MRSQISKNFRLRRNLKSQIVENKGGHRVPKLLSCLKRTCGHPPRGRGVVWPTKELAFLEAKLRNWGIFAAQRRFFGTCGSPIAFSTLETVCLDKAKVPLGPCILAVPLDILVFNVPNWSEWGTSLSHESTPQARGKIPQNN